MVFALGLSGRAHASQSPPFAEFAEAFRKEHKIETADPTDFDAQALLSREWLSARVGVFEMLYPRAGLENKPRQEERSGPTAFHLAQCYSGPARRGNA
jgi:hypothetical protein